MAVTDTPLGSAGSQFGARSDHCLALVDVLVKFSAAPVFVKNIEGNQQLAIHQCPIGDAESKFLRLLDSGITELAGAVVEQVLVPHRHGTAVVGANGGGTQVVVYAQSGTRTESVNAGSVGIQRHLCVTLSHSDRHSAG
ncbi:hypothetical protein D3C86_1702260 [compost metagenome]